MGWILFLLIGAAAGFLAGQLTRGRGFGAFGNILVGIVGALFGGFLFRLLGLASTGLVGQLVTATLGAAILLFLLQRLK